MAKNKLGTAVERSVALNVSSAGSGTGIAMLEMHNIASKLNHRLYRQTRNYRVRLQQTQDANAGRVMTQIFTLPDTWFVRGAIKYAYDTYMQNHADELANGIKFGRWHDFQISPQNPDGSYELLEPILYDGDGFASIAQDEPSGAAGTYSTTKAADGTSMGFHCIGNIANSYNILREFAEYRNNMKPDDESTTAVQPYGDLLDLKDAEAMVESGDRAPYDRDFSGWIPDDETVDDSTGQHILTLQDTIGSDQDGGSGFTTSKVINAPLGVIFLRNLVNGSMTDIPTSSPQLRLEFMPGSYKGIDAPSLV